MASSTTSIAKVWVSEGVAAYGVDWSKVPKKEVVDSVLKLARDGKHPDQYGVFFAISAQTGLRVCEVAHLRCEDLMPGNHMKVTRRKKRVLRPTIIDVFPSLWSVMADWCKGRTGWMFPGASRPCVIHRAPQFTETHCPDCGRHLLRVDQIRKRCDRIALFANHLQEHGRTPDEVQEWVEFSMKGVTQPVCNGGHVHIRSVQMRWRLMLTEVGGYVPGRGIHSLRHNFGVEMYRATHDIVKVKQLLGHENVTTTQVYATAVDTKETLEKLDGTI